MKASSWYSAVAARMSQTFSAPPVERVRSMGTVLWHSDRTNRSASITRRVVNADDRRRGLVWALWSEGPGGHPTLQYRRQEPLSPDEMSVERLVRSFRAWLEEGVAADDLEKIAGAGEPLHPLLSELTHEGAEHWGTREVLSVEIVSENWQLWVEGRNLCQHSLRSGGRRSALPLTALRGLSLWLSENWDSVVFGRDQRPSFMAEFAASPARAFEQASVLVMKQPTLERELEEWRRAHAIRTAHELLPNLFLERQGDELVLGWDSFASPEALFDIATGAAAIPIRFALPMFRDVLTWTANHHAETPEEKERILTATREDADRGYEVLASYGASADWLRSHVSPSEARSFAAQGTDRAPIIGLLRASQSGRVLSPEDLELLSTQLVRAPRGAFDRLRKAAARLPTSINPLEPWVSGYELARALRREFAPPNQPVDVDVVMAALGVQVVELALSSKEVQGICLGATGHKPVAIVNLESPATGGPSGRRVTVMHECCHLLFDRERMRGLAQVETSSRHPDQLLEKRANAFAVEFIFPMANFFEICNYDDDLLETELSHLAARFVISRDALDPHFGNFLNAYKITRPGRWTHHGGRYSW